jgi:hypothetical protein
MVASRHFARSALLSKFLLYIVAETIEGRQSEITEHQIGVRVFERAPSYRTVEDNIVRNYARQLRRRLADYYQNEGASEPLRIEVPVGGYAPIFLPASAKVPAEEDQQLPAVIDPQSEPTNSAAPHRGVAALLRSRWRWLLLGPLLILAYSAALVGITWYTALRFHARPHASTSTAPLWAAIFNNSTTSYIVPADAGFNLLEDVSQHPMPLANYMEGGYLNLPLPSLDAHSAGDLRTQQFTSFVDLQIVTSLERLPEFNPQHVMLRFPRDVHLEDLKNANVVILGSEGSNPWAAIAESNANFRIVDQGEMKGAVVVNSNPRPGEASFYMSHWNEPAHETFAVIEYLPNLAGTGRLLLLQGLDVAGTQAAAETLLHPSAIATILRRATRPDGSLRFFEILLRSTSIQSNAMATQVIASRIY